MSLPSASIAVLSHIKRVIVYARGAVVTRHVEIPDALADGSVTLVVPKISPLAEAGSLRSQADGERKVLGLKSAWVVPEGSVDRGELKQKVWTLEQELNLLQVTRAQYQHQRDALLNTQLRATSRSYRKDPVGRAKGVIAVNALIEEICGDIDRRLGELESETTALLRRLEAARAELAQSNQTVETSGKTNPYTNIEVQLSPSGTLSTLEISYTIPAARWWPAYSARLTDQGRKAQFILEAFVAQASHEDWSDVELGLCTADMVRDVGLPELASLRVGRVSPPKKRGYRPPPTGLETLFVHYDLAIASYVAIETKVAPPPRQHDKQAKEGFYERAIAPEEFEDDSFGEVAKLQAESAPMPQTMMMDMPEMMPLAASAPKSRSIIPSLDFFESAAPKRRSQRADMTRAGGYPGGGSPKPLPPPAPPALELGETWMDFDNLVLGDVSNPAYRGRLTQRTIVRDTTYVHSIVHKIDTLTPPGLTRDPLYSRGQFDHKFEADGLVEVPSNGLPHRISLTNAEAETSTSLRAVPSQAEEVYREIGLRNPFNAPLLAGPVDVFVDDALTMTSAIEAVDRGGTITFGLGVEERIRVVRNVRMRESSKGLLGGTSSLRHTVSIEIASALGHTAKLVLVDRLPTSEDKDIEVELLNSTPRAEPYTQADRGQPTEGGLLWELEIPAGGKMTVQFEYDIQIPAKYELVGGNRRD